MARKQKDENMSDQIETNGEDQVTAETAVEDTAAEDTASARVEASTVEVENAITEDQARQRVAQMLKGRKSYHLCDQLNAGPSTISGFAKGKNGMNAKMVEGLGLREVSTYVIVDEAKFYGQ